MGKLGKTIAGIGLSVALLGGGAAGATYLNAPDTPTNPPAATHTVNDTPTATEPAQTPTSGHAPTPPPVYTPPAQREYHPTEKDLNLRPPPMDPTGWTAPDEYPTDITVDQCQGSREVCYPEDTAAG